MGGPTTAPGARPRGIPTDDPRYVKLADLCGHLKLYSDHLDAAIGAVVAGQTSSMRHVRKEGGRITSTLDKIYKLSESVAKENKARGKSFLEECR